MKRAWLLGFSLLCALTPANDFPDEVPPIKPATTSAQQAGRLAPLQRELNEIAEGFNGRLGYALVIPATDEEISFRGDERFPSASTIKTAVMMEAFWQVEEGTLEWDEAIALPPVEDRNASMWTYFLRDPIEVDVDALVNLMMNVSDNTATVVLANRLGAENIEQRMLDLGLENTAWTSNPPPDNQRLVRLRETFRNMGVTTPREMARLLQVIYNGEGISRAAREKMIRIMSHQYWDDWIDASVPVDVVVASKVGALNRSRSDTAIVFAEQPYILTIYTDNQADQSWKADNEGHLAIQEIALRVWNFLNPDRPRTLPEDFEKWLPTGGGVSEEPDPEEATTTSG
jgi:beta-lactamase class A